MKKAILGLNQWLPTLLLLIGLAYNVDAQQVLLKGRISSTLENQSTQGIKVLVEPSGMFVFTDAKGRFQLDMNYEEGAMVVFLQDEIELKRDILPQPASGQEEIDLGRITLYISPSATGTIPTISLNADQIDEEDTDDLQFSGLLGSGRDAFTATMGFVFGRRWHRFRGYDNRELSYYVNGVPVNELNDGRIFFNTWGGLNDVTRGWDNDLGIGAAYYSFGGVGGSIHLNMRASRQRAQKRVSIAQTNSGYSSRLMGTWSTGMLQNNWAFSFSASRRWAQEGYVDGTFYDAWSYYAAAEKRFNDQHSLSLTAFGAPIRRGRSTASVAEVYELTDNPYYNPNWGYQNGEKRNSRVGNRHQPMAILTHDWNISPKSVLKTAVSYQAGRDGTTALDWFDARDPRPDFYRRLPSYIASTSSPTTAGQVEEILRNDPDLLQVNWDNMYEVNRHSFRTIEDADGIQGNTVSGNFSRYIVEDRRFDSKKANFYTKFQQELNQNWSLQSGLSYQWYQGRRYKVVDDLLGGDFYVNLDRFAERDFPGNDDAQQIDLNNPNQILREGDIFGYNYDADIHKAEAWLQGQFRYGPFEGFVAGDLSSTRFWLTGRFRNGKFPDDSFGEGEKQSFINYGTKAGLTYIINGRNYLFANGSYRTRAPFFRNSYVSPRTRHQLAPNLKSMSIASTEGGYILRSPDYKARIVAYYTRFEDDIRAISFYHDEQRTFVNYIVNGIDTEHKGIEVALEAKLFPGLNAKAVASIGQHQHISRPTATVSQDNTAALLEEQQTLYLNNFFVSNGPQSAYNLGLAYQPGNWWTFWVDLSYFHRSWVSPNPVRRTEAAVSLDPTGIDKVDYQSELWNDILAQEELDGFFMLDISTRKSFKWGDYYLACNLGVSNLLNNQSYITSGYEQLRFDFEGKDVNRFPARYFNGFGINYFLNLSLSF